MVLRITRDGATAPTATPTPKPHANHHSSGRGCGRERPRMIRWMARPTGSPTMVGGGSDPSWCSRAW